MIAMIKKGVTVNWPENKNGNTSDNAVKMSDKLFDGSYCMQNYGTYLLSS